MALIDNAWYVNYGDGSTTGYYAVAPFSVKTYAAGNIIRQLTAPAVGSERCFVCVVAGLSVAEPSWTTTRGALNTSTTPVFQECTGIAALNGDLTNTPVWTAATAYTLGQVIARVSLASYQICTVAGTSAAVTEPGFSNTAGVLTPDGVGALVWTSLGAVGNFTGWQAPHARLATAFVATWGAAGDSFYISKDHAETQGSAMTLTSPGTAGSPCFIYCVDQTGTVAPVSADLKTTATITTTGNFALTITGYAYFYGITFSAGSGVVAALLNIATVNVAHALYFKSCAMAKAGTTGVNGAIVIGQIATANLPILVVFDNTTVKFGAVADSFSVRNCRFVWKNTPTAIAGAAFPTNLFFSTGTMGAYLDIEGVDLSALGAGKTLVASTVNAAQRIIFKDCKLGASVVVAATPPSQGGAETYVVRSDSTGTNYRHEKYNYMGTQTVETTIVRTGGATDGTTPLAWKIVTTANSKWVLPFECIPITIWNDSTSAMTVVLFGNFTAVPNDDQIWMDIEYLGAAGNPQGSFVTTTKADNLAASAASNNTSDTSTWGAGANTAFKMTSPSFTPAQKGPLTIYVKAALAGSTFYIDPQVSISGITVSKSQILAPGVYANSLSAGAGGLPFSRVELGM